jgi:undecaprenyl-diphosphatase
MDRIESIDLGTLYFFQTHRGPWLTRLMLSLTHRGDQSVLWIDVTLIACGFLLWGRWRSALLFVAVALGSWYMNDAVKKWVRRDRPAEAVHPPIPVPKSFSFPSGHAANTMAIYLCAALLAARGLGRAHRIGLVAVALALALGIGTSRMYLGVHYLTDVLAGWCAGLAIALLARGLVDLLAPEGAAAAEKMPIKPP